MGKTGFEKATAKMFGSFGPAVRIAESGGAGERLSREERERMRREAAESEEREQRSKEREEIVRTLVDMKVIPSGGEGGEGKAGAEAVKEEPAVREAPSAAEEGKGRGRPLKNPEVGEYVLMNFRVDAEFRQRLKMMAVGQGRSVISLFEEAFELLFEKYGQ